MKIRTLYQKVQDLEKAKAFWTSFLDQQPALSSANWCSFQLENLNFALLLNDFGDELKGSNAVPVFEFAENELEPTLQRAKSLGAIVVLDGLKEPKMKSIVFKDPSGNEFEISLLHS
jgi:predicted lactoylglutathione lyase